MAILKTLVKIDKNGSKHWEGLIPCDRCGGQGGSDAWKYTGYTCYKCGGTGVIKSTWIERTPEYQAKLDAMRAKRNAKRMAEIEAENAKLEAERKEQERIEAELEAERIAQELAQKRISQFIGQEGDRITAVCTYDHTAWYEFHMGWMTQTMYIHTFRDEKGNVIVWKTSSNSLPEFDEGDQIEVKGTVKEHTTYKDEKQTVLTRCKVKEVK